MRRLRLVFMGTPDFAVPALAALMAAGHEIVRVYTQMPKPAGRGRKETRSAVHDFALQHGLTLATPRSLKGADEAAAFAALAPDAAIVAAYGLILPPEFLTVPRLGCLNIHASLLPRWRGAAPIQSAILAGDSETGVTIMQMDAGLDTGAILAQARTPIGPAATAAHLHDALAALGAGLNVETLAALDDGRVAPAPQPDEGACYAPKLGRDDGRLDWRRPAATLARAVRALNPWPGTWFEHGGLRIKVLAAVAEDDGPRAEPGAVLDAAPRIACGVGALRLVVLQRPGGAPLPAAQFLRGYALPPGTSLDGASPS